MRPCIICGSANPALGAAIARELEVAVCETTIERFPDGEMRVEIHAPIRGRDIYIVEPTAPPVSDSLIELLLLGDAAKRAGAARTIALIPYFGYARADRRTREGQPLASAVVGELLGRARFDRVIAVDLHAPAIEGSIPMPVDHLSALPVLIQTIAAELPSHAIIVAPDLGAAKRAHIIARELKLPVAIVHKTRQSGTEVSVHAVVGDVRDRAPILVDDMISTGGTIVAAAEALRAHGARSELVIAATHGLFVGTALDRLSTLNPSRILVTDSITPPEHYLVETASIAPLLAEAIRRLELRSSISDLLMSSS